MDWNRIYGVQEFLVFAVLEHLPLVVDLSIAPALLVIWSLAMASVAILALVTNLGWPAAAREYEAELGALEVTLCGVGCAVVAVVLLRSAAPTPYTYGLAAAAGLAAVALVGAGVRPHLTARRR
jgi:hypothetical protein